MAENIAHWLERVGLGQYAKAFADNKIDVDILPDLSDADLENLDIPLGDRKRLRRAIAVLSDNHGTNKDATPEATSRASSPAEAERRQLTVLFCDIVGSTELSAKLDPEDMREVLRAYQETCAQVIARYDGYVAKFMGDGVYAYFGYPIAHEDDAERAITAGLGMVEAVAALEHDLAVRIGFGTGNVAVGDLIGESEEAAIVGEAPNLAARLQAVADPNMVVIGEATHTLAGGMFETEDLGEQIFKGFDKPVHAWSITGQGRSESRFEAIRGERLTELVGREEELQMLRRRWQQAKDGEGQVVLISGEPGIGKSRLVHTFRESISGEPTHFRLLQCSPHHNNSAMFPFLEPALSAIGITPGVTNETKLDKLETWIRAAGQDPVELAPIFGPFLNIDTTVRYPPNDLPPQLQKAKLFEAFSQRLLRISESQGLVFVIEDSHWIDPSTLELLGMHIEQARDHPNVMIIVTYRPEFDAPWVGQPHTTLLALNRLSRRQCATLVTNVSGAKTLGPEVIDQISERTDGVPLFVEELTKAVVETSGTDFAGTNINVPATLQDSLEARLDRLGAAKEVAQIGSVIGREFDYALLARVFPLDDSVLNPALDELVNSGIASVRGTPPNATYIFKHALLRDTAYASMLRGRRAEMHSAIAQVLDKSFPDKASSEPELLAYHYTEAGLTQQAIDYWQRAGKRAAERSADVEAMAHFNKALELLATQPKGKDRDLRELELHIALTGPIIAVKGYAAPELEQTNARALTLCDRVGDVPDIFPVLYGRWALLYTSGRMAESRDWAKEVVRWAEAQPGAVPRILGYRVFGSSSLMTGNPAEAEQNLARAWELYGETTGEADNVLFGQDVKVSICTYRSLALWYGGMPDQALLQARESLERARELRHVNTLGYAYFHHAFLCSLVARFDEVGSLGALLIEIAEQNKLELWAIAGRLFQAWSSIDSAADGDRIGRFEKSLAEYRNRQMGFMAPRLYAVMATAYGKAGYPDRGITIIGEQLAEIEQSGQRVDEAELYRLWGELEILRNAPHESETRFVQALDIARAQSARSWELRAATSLARLWQSQGKTSEARDLLTPVYDWFTEGFDTVDLKGARALLDELS